MQDVVPSVAPRRQAWWSFVALRVRSEAPSFTDSAAALLTAGLLILSFPGFGWWFLAWVGLVPLFLVLARKPSLIRAFAVGWLAGTAFFYGSCYWLTYSMIHYGGLPVWLAFLLLIPGAAILGLFPGTFSLLLVLANRQWGKKSFLLAPFAWIALEWIRLLVSGQLWNAIGYSQAYQAKLIQTAQWGGVYAVGFLILTVNAALAFLLLNRSLRAFAISLVLILAVVAVVLAGFRTNQTRVNHFEQNPQLLVVALQPNVPMDPAISTSELEDLVSIHIFESEAALAQLPITAPRLVIWPESPMNFAYGSDAKLRDRLAQFAIRNQTSLLLNSMERTAGGNGVLNSAVLVNEQGRAIAQYDKIRLMPFGEYVPLPHWLPGASLITAIVGDFTPGDKYTQIPAGRLKAGVFICIEAAYPSIARTFTAEGADILINISNDGYLGPTAVMRQHLANAIFRAVENGRPLLRVTNSGITAFITATGEVKDETGGFQRAVRVWKLDRGDYPTTFYSRHGDLLAVISAVLTTIVFLLTLRGLKKKFSE
jgi:apolipoprotein N-acyltransferase